MATAAKKTIAEHLQHASLLFGAGEVVKAGQIWQAILKIHPSNEEAKAGLLKVRDALSKATTEEPKPEVSLVEPESAATNSRNPAELLIKQGRAHYDQGSLQEALVAWEKALEIDPGNNLALSYARGVRKELGLPIPETMGAVQGPPSKRQPSELEGSVIGETAAQLQSAKGQDEASSGAVGNKRPPEGIAAQIEKGSQLYKMGKIVEAIAAWESALSMDPSSTLVKGYLAMAWEDLDGRRQPSPVGISPKKRDTLGGPEMPELGRQGGAVELADASEIAPQSTPLAIAVDANSIEADVQAAGEADFGNPPEPEPPSRAKRPLGPATTPREGAPTKMPAIIIENQAKTRQGPDLPQKLHGVPFLSRLFTPTAVKVASILIFVVAGATAWALWARRDALLRATQAAIVGEAIKAARRSVKDVSLSQSADELKSEARSAMSSDPLMAYLFVQELVNRYPNDTSPAKMLEQAKQAMAVAPKAKADGDLNRLLSDGALDDAEALLKSMLMQSPNNTRARENLARVCLMQARHLVANGQWGKARARLQMGAALYPRDPSWQARIKFLESIQSLTKEDHARWAEMLG
ncbi:MAG: tetratricopeptide repeat protein [Holophagales bacterium]|nr:tetratricopeptide repeat protein [Holophagales bacterium]